MGLLGQGIYNCLAFIKENKKEEETGFNIKVPFSARNGFCLLLILTLLFNIIYLLSESDELY